MTITATSQQAYSNVIPKLPGAQFQVYKCLWEHPFGLTNAEVSFFLNWPINRITPRTNELRKLGCVRFLTTRKCNITGNQASVWIATEKNPQFRFNF